MSLKIIIPLAACLFLASCASNMGVDEDEVRYFDRYYTAYIRKGIFHIGEEGVNPVGPGLADLKPFRMDRLYATPQTLIELFGIRGDTTDQATVEFDGESNLMLSYASRGIWKTVVFDGRFTAEGYYEIYLCNEAVEIPAGFHFIYSDHNVYRLRFARTADGEFLVDVYGDTTGNIFLSGWGESSRQQFFFRAGL